MTNVTPKTLLTADEFRSAVLHHVLNETKRYRTATNLGKPIYVTEFEWRTMLSVGNPVTTYTFNGDDSIEMRPYDGTATTLRFAVDQASNQAVVGIAGVTGIGRGFTVKADGEKGATFIA